jgi:hypothetical protein
MKRLPSPRRFYTGPLKLYREDLEELIELFRKHASSDVEIADAEYSYESLNEVAQRLGEKVGYLTVTAVSLRVRLIIGWPRKDENTRETALNPSRLVSEMGGPAADTLYLVVKDFLVTKRRTWARVLVTTALMLSGILFLIAVSAETASKGYPHAGSVGFAALIVSGLLFICGTVPSIVNLDRVTLRSKRESRPFWRRYEDDIWKFILAGIIGGVIQWAFSHVLR